MVFLGTSIEIEEIYKIVENLGFDFKIDPVFKAPYQRKPFHKTVEGLQLQIHPPVYHRGIEDVTHDIEYMAEYNFPPNELDNCQFYMVPEHLQILKEMYDKMPDLIYLKDFNEWFKTNKADKPKVRRYPLSDFFEEIKKRKK